MGKMIPVKVKDALQLSVPSCLVRFWILSRSPTQFRLDSYRLINPWSAETVEPKDRPGVDRLQLI